MPEVQPDPNKPLRVVGRYALYGKLATGGMATVHFGRLLGPVGFSRTVAIKRLHPEFAKDKDFVDMFLDEARLAARIQHPNVVATVDVVAMDQELFLVMDYVRGEAFSRVLRAAKRKGVQLPEGFIGSVVSGMLHGLHAAHEATDERGEPLKVVHRDVSPQNVLVGVDGVARVLDFGVAKAAARVQVTRDGQMKGKLSYMSPEQLQGRHVDRRSDVFASGVVLWEALTGQRLFTGADASEILTKILSAPVPPPSQVNPQIRPELDALVLRALEKDPDVRFPTSRAFAIAVEETMQILSPREVGEWVEEVAGDSLEARESALAEIESISAVGHLTAFNDSDPQLMRTLTDTWRGHAAAAPPPSAGETDDAATTIFHGNNLLDPLPGDDPTLVFHNTEELTQPGRRQAFAGEDNPFATPQQKKKKLLMFGVGGAAVLLVFLLIAAVSGGDESEGDAPDVATVASTASAPHAPTSAAEPSTEALDVEDLARADDSDEPPESDDAADSDEKNVRPVAVKQGNPARGPKPAAAKSGAGKPSGKSADSKGGRCAQPWTIDPNGIRRIKPGCL